MDAKEVCQSAAASRRLLFFLACFAFSSAAAQSGQSSSASSTFDEISVAYTYSGSYPTIRDVDFANLTWHYFDTNGKATFAARLKNGKFDRKSKLFFDSVSLDSVHFLPSVGAEEYAVGLYDWFSAAGSSSESGIAQVFELHNHRLKVVQQSDWDQHYGGPWNDSFDEQARALMFQSAHYLPGDAHCCVSAIDVVVMQWNGSRLVQSSIRTELSEYGKREGKTLTEP
jgi:hypothetical protein